MSMPAMPLSSPASLRLFAPDEDPTLLTLYTEKLQQHRQAEATAAADLEAVRLFESLHPALPARKINEEHVLRFMEHLRNKMRPVGTPKRKGDGLLSLATINRQCRHLSQVLKQLGQSPAKKSKGFWNSGAATMPFLGMLQEVPAVEAPPVDDEPVERHLEAEEIGALLGVCETITWDELLPGAAKSKPIFSIPAPQYWTAVMTFSLHTGLRRIELLKGKREWLVVDQHGPWLDVPKVKRVSTRRFVYLNRHALAAKAVFDRVESELLLAWPYGPRYFDEMIRKIFSRVASARLDGIKIGGFRKSCATALTKLGGPELASMHLGHKLDSMTTRRYTHRSATVPYIEQLVQPQPIYRVEPPDPQLKLFE
jgi:integrase